MGHFALAVRIGAYCCDAAGELGREQGRQRPTAWGAQWRDMLGRRNAAAPWRGMSDLELCAWILLAYLPAATVLSLVLLGSLD
jgi:hypothetical protein